MSVPQIDNSLFRVYGPEGVALVNNLQSLVKDKYWTLDFIGKEGFVAILGCRAEVPIQEIQAIFAQAKPGKYAPIVSESFFCENRIFHLIQPSNLSAKDSPTQADITPMMTRRPPPLPGIITSVPVNKG